MAGGRIAPAFYDEALSLALKGVGVRNMNARERIVSPLFRLKLRGVIRGFSVSSGTARRVAGAAAGDEPSLFEPPLFEPPAPGMGLTPATAAVVSTRAVAFHFADDPVGGAGSTQVRVFGPIARAFRVSQVQLYPVGAVQVGQFFSLLISPDGDRTNVVTPTGSPVFQESQLPAGIGAVDSQAAVQIPERPISLTVPAVIVEEGRFLKAHLFFVTPATVLPDVHVVVTIEELEAAPVAG